MRRIGAALRTRLRLVEPHGPLLASNAIMVAVSDASLGGALCLNLRTFRKDGMPIDTPVWVVPFEGHVALFCDDRSYKAKRLRRNPQVEVAPCDVWGKCSGPWQPGVCRIVEDPERRKRGSSS